MKLLEIADGLAILPRRISAVKRCGEKGEKCSVMMAADNATYGGFLVDRDFDELVEEINEALEDTAYDGV